MPSPLSDDDKSYYNPKSPLRHNYTDACTNGCTLYQTWMHIPSAKSLVGVLKEDLTSWSQIFNYSKTLIIQTPIFQNTQYF